MNPEDFDCSSKGFEMDTIENPEPTPKYQENDRLFGNRGDNSPEFAGRVKTVTDFGNGTVYLLTHNETDWFSGDIEWFQEEELSRLSLLDRVRRLEHFLEIDE